MQTHYHKSDPFGGSGNGAPASSFPETRQANKPPLDYSHCEWVKADEAAHTYKQNRKEWKGGTESKKRNKGGVYFGPVLCYESSSWLTHIRVIKMIAEVTKTQFGILQKNNDIWLIFLKPQIKFSCWGIIQSQCSEWMGMDLQVYPAFRMYYSKISMC